MPVPPRGAVPVLARVGPGAQQVERGQAYDRVLADVSVPGPVRGGRPRGMAICGLVRYGAPPHLP